MGEWFGIRLPSAVAAMPVHSEQDDISGEQWKATGSGKWGFRPLPFSMTMRKPLMDRPNKTYRQFPRPSGELLVLVLFHYKLHPQQSR